MSCVAGAWINSHNKAGLDGFTCAACLQVVSKLYAELDSKMRQELFFASRMKLQLAVDTRPRRSVTSSGALQTGGSTNKFVAEILPGAADTVRRFRSLTDANQCLKESELRLTASTCDTDPSQMMEAVELGSLLWHQFQAGTDVPKTSQSPLLNTGSGPTTLRSFQLNANCGQHVLSSIQFSYYSQLGMSANCTAASTYGDEVEYTLPVPGDITITSVSDGTCMSIHRIIPFRLRVKVPLPVGMSAHRCLRHAAGDDDSNVNTASCTDENVQQFYMVNGNIISTQNGKCLDYHMENANVYMHQCHGRANQKWYVDEGSGALRSEWNDKCMERKADGNVEVVDNCHGGMSQKFDFDKQDLNAFTRALHLECSESEKEAITVDPIGDHDEHFRLKHGQFLLPGEFKWTTQKTLYNRGSKKCLEADALGRVEERQCTEHVEQEWTLSHGLFGLTDSPLTCSTDQIISYVQKTSDEIKFKCSHVSSMGACTPHYSSQVETKSSDLKKIKALRALGAFCPPNEGLKSFETEASDKGAWIRIKYTCCQISRIPLSIYPTLQNGKREFEAKAEDWEGIYCPESLDDSGRMMFKQGKSFRPGHTGSRTLRYDKLEGKWCISKKDDCVFSDVVHPLDTSLHTSDTSSMSSSDAWYVVPVSDFDGSFEAKGAKQPAAEKRRKPPQLIKFGASAPEYLPECKDESHPGSPTFKLADMNEEARA